MVYIIFLILLQKNIDRGYSIEPPRRGGSNKYPQSMIWAGIWKISDFFNLKIFLFLVVKFSIYLNRRFRNATKCLRAPYETPLHNQTIVATFKFSLALMIHHENMPI